MKEAEPVEDVRARLAVGEAVVEAAELLSLREDGLHVLVRVRVRVRVGVGVGVAVGVGVSVRPCPYP